jgi:hypothetical protein
VSGIGKHKDLIKSNAFYKQVNDIQNIVEDEINLRIR